MWSVSRGAMGRVLGHSILARALLDRKLGDYTGRPAGRDFYSVFQSSLSSRHLASEPHACNCGNPLEQILMRGCSQRIWISVLGLCVRVASVLGKNNYQPQMRANLCKGQGGLYPVHSLTTPPSLIFSLSCFLCNHPQPPKHPVDWTTKISFINNQISAGCAGLCLQFQDSGG